MSEDIKKGRGPTCPQKSLAEALDLIRTVFEKAGRSKAKPAALAGIMGYNGLNGTALRTLAVLNQYGFIEKDGKESLSVSDLAIRLLHPVDETQRIQALRESALKPKVFETLYNDGFHHASEDAVSKHLIQSGFSEDSANGAAEVFMQNITFAKLKENGIKSEHAPNNNSMPKVSREPLPQFVWPKPADQAPDTFAPPLPMVLGELSLPLENGKIIRIPKMTEEDFDLFTETLKLWRHRIVIKPHQTKFPLQATWKNKDFDKPVKIVAEMGIKDGVRYFQSEDGTGIPEPELTFAV